MTARLTILREPSSFKAGVFQSLADIAGGAKWRRVIGVRRKGYPETEVRTRVAFERAKHMPKSAVMQYGKRHMIAAQYNWSRAYFEDASDQIAVAWNGLTGSRMAYMMGARDAGAGRLYVELAPFAGHITLDHAGLNAESSVPRTRGGLGDARLGATRQSAMADALVARGARGRGVGQEKRDLPDAPFLFCPLQVPNDSQVRVFGGWAGSVMGFAEAVARSAGHLPPGWHIRIKEHPSARDRLTADLERLAGQSGGRVVIDNQSDTFDQVRASRGVVTMNSSLALQSFLLDKPVVVTGEAFFAVPGLVDVAGSEAELTARFQAAEGLDYDAHHRDALLGYLMDRYLVPFTEDTGGRVTLDRDRALEKIALSQSVAA